MYLITLTLVHDCEVSRLSLLHPEVSFAHWCYSGLELIEMASSDPNALLKLERDMPRLLSLGFKKIRPKEDTKRKPKLLLITRVPSRPGLICINMEQLGCPPLYPVLYDHGVERYSIVALQDRKVTSLPSMLDGVCKFKIIEKRRIEVSEFLEKMLSPLPSIVSKLTRKQAESLALAFATGYYALPRKVAMTEIASRANVKRTAYREHIRKAERKIMGEVVPYLGLVPYEQRSKTSIRN